MHDSVAAREALFRLPLMHPEIAVDTVKRSTSYSSARTSCGS
ncbi:hypothetical protein ACFQ0X_42470 [Streptomyces rectiviolaceus]